MHPSRSLLVIQLPEHNCARLTFTASPLSATPCPKFNCARLTSPPRPCPPPRHPEVQLCSINFTASPLPATPTPRSSTVLDLLSPPDPAGHPHSPRSSTVLDLLSPLRPCPPPPRPEVQLCSINFRRQDHPAHFNNLRKFPTFDTKYGNCPTHMVISPISSPS